MQEIKNKVKYINVSELVELDNNPRYIIKERFEKLKKSIKDNSDYFEARPIICSNRTGKNIILAGNQRYKASLELGLKEVPCIILNNLTEEKEKEILIRDNIELGDWDYDILANEWNEDDFIEWGGNINFKTIDNIDSNVDNALELKNKDTKTINIKTNINEYDLIVEDLRVYLNEKEYKYIIN